MAEIEYVAGIRHPRYQVDQAFYQKVLAAKTDYKLVEKFTVPHQSGRGFHVKQGHAFRFVTIDGPQIGDVNLWNAHDSKEFLCGTRTWIVNGFVIKVGSQLWSEVPYFRPMATCIEDTIITDTSQHPYHHSDVRSHCTSELKEMITGQGGLNSCHMNFLQAIEPFGLKEEDIHDTLMVHQKTWVDAETGRVHVTRGDSKPGDYTEFYAEMDLLVALSVCPGGDGTGTGKSTGDALRPLGVEVYDTGIQPKKFPGWYDWRPGWKGEWMPPES